MASKKLGETLRRLRTLKGYTQQQVADLLGLKNKSTLGSWEVGKSEPDGYTFLRLCRIYEVTDIYAAFEEDASVRQRKDASHDVLEKYRQLTPEMKKIADSLILQLAELPVPKRDRQAQEE